MEEETQLLAPLGNLLEFGPKMTNSYLDFEKSLSLPLDGFNLENEIENESDQRLVNEMENYEELMKEIEDGEEPAIIKEASKLHQYVSSARHSTPIYQMLERIENKVKLNSVNFNRYKISILDQS